LVSGRLMWATACTDESGHGPQHGKFLAPPGLTTTIEGNPPKRAAVIEFESVDRAVATFGSAAYRNARKIGDK
jgi:uncharacterized protein (DUF1330 family)